MKTVAQRIAEGRRAYPDTFDPSELEAVDVSIRRAYESGARVEVTRTYEDGSTWVRRGRVSSTTGWRPAFILMSRRDSTGSSDVLGPGDVVTGVVSR